MSVTETPGRRSRCTAIGACSLFELTAMGDERGSLVALEGGKDVPFDIGRVYYVYGTQPETVRGRHAHLKLDQLATCVSGSCTFLLDDGSERCEVRLDRPNLGLHIGPMVWREMHDFSPDCVLLVLASMPYDECDYIRDYDRFLELVRMGAGVAV